LIDYLLHKAGSQCYAVNLKTVGCFLMSHGLDMIFQILQSFHFTTALLLTFSYTYAYIFGKSAFMVYCV